MPQQLECVDIGKLRGLLRDGRDNAWYGLDIIARAQHLHGVLSRVHMDGASEGQHGVLPPRSSCRSLMQPCNVF